MCMLQLITNTPKLPNKPTVYISNCMRIKNQRSTLNVSSDYPIPAINQISNYSYNQTYTKVSKNATSTAYNLSLIHI